MALSLSREFLLVAACAMWPPSDRRNETIRAVAARPLDWPICLRVAKRHQVIGLVHDGLTRVRPNVPPEIAREIGAEAATLTRENVAMAVEAVRLQRLFDGANLPVLFLKGASLAALAYGNLAVRGGKDIDLLVPPEMLPAASALLASSGYLRSNPPPEISISHMRLLMRLRKDLGFVNLKSGLGIELHWRLFLNPHAMRGATIMAAPRVVPLTGTAGLRTLGAEDLFAYLCVHGALHWWYQLKWLADIGALLAAAPEGGAEHLYWAAKARGAERAAGQAMLLCQCLLDTPLPAPLMKKFKERPVLRWLQQTALTAMTTGDGERNPRELRFGTTRGSLSALLLGQGWRYRLAELRNLLINESDVLAVPLPDWLRFLYLIMRLPLWIRRQLGRREQQLIGR